MNVGDRGISEFGKWLRSIVLLEVEFLHLVEAPDLIALRPTRYEWLSLDHLLILFLPLQIFPILFHGGLHIPVGLKQVVPSYFSILLLTINPQVPSNSYEQQTPKPSYPLFSTY